MSRPTTLMLRANPVKERPRTKWPAVIRHAKRELRETNRLPSSSRLSLSTETEEHRKPGTKGTMHEDNNYVTIAINWRLSRPSSAPPVDMPRKRIPARLHTVHARRKREHEYTSSIRRLTNLRERQTGVGRRRGSTRMFPSLHDIRNK